MSDMKFDLQVVTPEGIRFEGAVRSVTLPASEGSTVPLYALGGLSCSLDDETNIAEGDWETFGTGTVDADGYVVADAANGLPCLIWMGIGAPETADPPADGGTADAG